MPSKLSREYVRVPVTVTKAGSPYNPTSDTVQLALTDPTATPGSGDWFTGDWETVGSTYYARLLVGPGANTVDYSGVSGNANKRVWVKVTDNPEVPVIAAGFVLFT